MSDQETITSFKRKLEREIRAREVAEKLLEDRSGELYDSLLELQDSEDLLKNAIDSMQEGLLVTTDKFQVILHNEKLRSIYPEWSHCFHKGMLIKHLFNIYAQHPALSALEAENTHITFEVNLSDGRIIAVSVIKNSDGSISSTHKDVTTIKASFQEQQKLLIKLMQAQRMDSIGKMAGGIAHDFNNIIAAIKGYAGFLEEDIPDNPKLKNSVTKINQAAVKAEELVQHILDYGQADKIEYTAVEVEPLIDESIELVKATISSRINIKLKQNQYPGFFNGSGTQISQIIVNLLMNSIQAIGDKEGKITIEWNRHNKLDLSQTNFSATGFHTNEASLKVAGLHIFSSPCICISIKDNGCGMDKHTLDHMFDMFFSTRIAKEGHGLGMYNVVRLVTEHSGGMRIHSKPNTGTLIEVVIPSTQSFELQQAASQTMAVNPGAAVLLVDDEKDAGHVLCHALHRAGIAAQYFEHSTQALSAFLEQSNHWSLIISDQMMPELKGTQLLKKLRDEGYEVPFIIYSGHIMEDEHAHYVELANHVFKKPMDVKLLINTVKKYI